MKIKPLYNTVVVKRKPKEEKSSGGIYIPDTASKDEPIVGIVVAVGKGRLSKEGEIIPLNIKVDDAVVFSKYGGTEVELDGEKYLFLKDDEILAVLE